MKIITHDGYFHADEVFAIGLLRKVLGYCPIERRRNISEVERRDPDTWVLDVGRLYLPNEHNFDHHQDVRLPATDVLILKYLYEIGLITEEQYFELEATFEAISEIDCNGYLEVTGFQVNSLIRSMNNIPQGFEFALEIADKYVEAAFDTVKKIASSREIWDRGQIHPSGLARICEAYPVHWKRYKEQPFLIYPDLDGTWKMVSIDSNTHLIPTTGNEIFRHNNGFIAVYATKKLALDAVMEFGGI